MEFNHRQVAVGLFALLAGVALYLADRPPEQVYFLRWMPRAVSLRGVLPEGLGGTGGSLPAFLHVFAFSLLTAGVLACRRPGCLAVCLAWLAVNAAFEWGQKYGVFASGLVPRFFEGIPFLENTRRYFLRGTFDVMDLAAAAAGAAAAYGVLVLTARRRGCA